MATKNLGQVAGIHVGTTAPQNKSLLWWDSTPSQQCHKIYDYTLNQWVALSQSLLSNITYSELRNIAVTNGLTLGKFYVITDKDGVVAISISNTKVQYVDLMGNLLVDDLASNITYFISSQNLNIDGESAEFNESKAKLDFTFKEQAPEIDTAYLYGKDADASSGLIKLVKFKLKSLISSVAGNSITWNNGLFLNFTNSIKNILDKKGGVVSKDTYDTDMSLMKKSIDNVGKENQEIIQNANTLIEQKTNDKAVYYKKVPNALETGGEPIDAARGDTLYTILSKFQRFINRFKYATGIQISRDFMMANPAGNYNIQGGNDTVESALGKVQRYIFEHSSTVDPTGSEIILSNKELEPLTQKPSSITKDDTVTQALLKLAYYSPVKKFVLDTKDYAVTLDSTYRLMRVDIHFPEPLPVGAVIDISFFAMLQKNGSDVVEVPFHYQFCYRRDIHYIDPQQPLAPPTNVLLYCIVENDEYNKARQYLFSLSYDDEDMKLYFQGHNLVEPTKTFNLSSIRDVAMVYHY